jgi:hypothetical protein
MAQPRRELSTVEIASLCAAYSLGGPVSWELAYEGTSTLYRMVCGSAEEPRTVAVKVQDGGRAVFAAKSLEAVVLAGLRPAFPAVPVLLQPGAARASLQSREWGLVTGRFAVSVYEWVDRAVPWQWSPEQRRATVAALGQLQAGLDALSTTATVAHRAEFQPTILDVGFHGFAREFGASEWHRRQLDPSGGLDQAELGYLDDRLRLLHRSFLDEWRQLAETATGLAHADFTPGNCGYAADGSLSVVFDFESVRLGVLPLFGAVSVGAFSINPAATGGQVAGAIREITDGLRRHCPPLSSAPGFTLPLLRLGYLDAARRQLRARQQNPIRRWGFLKDDMNNLRWLDNHESLIVGI